MKPTERGVGADTALRLQKTWELRRTKIEASREIAQQVTSSTWWCR